MKRNLNTQITYQNYSLDIVVGDPNTYLTFKLNKIFYILDLLIVKYFLIKIKCKFQLINRPGLKIEK